MTPEISEQKRLRIVSEIHEENRQSVIAFAEALEKIMRQRSAAAMKKTAGEALRKRGYL